MNCVQCGREPTQRALDECQQVIVRHRYDPGGNGGADFVELIDGCGNRFKVCGRRCADAFIRRVRALKPVKR